MASDGGSGPSAGSRSFGSAPITVAFSGPWGCGPQAAGASRSAGTSRRARARSIAAALRATLHSASIWISRAHCITEVNQLWRVGVEMRVGQTELVWTCEEQPVEELR